MVVRVCVVWSVVQHHTMSRMMLLGSIDTMAEHWRVGLIGRSHYHSRKRNRQQLVTR